MATATMGVAIPPEASLEELARLAADVERLGFDSLWVNDDRLQKDVFTVLAAIASHTERIMLGPGVTNPYSRHPALITTAIATIDELTGGRAVLGLGAGGTNHRQLAIERRAPATALRETLTIVRGLLAGERVTVDGSVVHARDARLDFEPPRADLPVYIGARGPRSLELAGELADGAIVGNVATADGWAYALARVDEGRARTGRGERDVTMTAWMYCSVGDDAEAAVDAVRPMVATSLTTSRPILDQLGVAMPPAFADVMQQADWRLDADTVAHAGQFVPEEVVHSFALAGTPTACRQRLAALLDAVPRIARVVVIPFPGPGQRRRDVVELVAGEVGADLLAPARS